MVSMVSSTPAAARQNKPLSQQTGTVRRLCAAAMSSPTRHAERPAKRKRVENAESKDTAPSQPRPAKRKRVENAESKDTPPAQPRPAILVNPKLLLSGIEMALAQRLSRVPFLFARRAVSVLQQLPYARKAMQNVLCDRLFMDLQHGLTRFAKSKESGLNPREVMARTVIVSFAAADMFVCTAQTAVLLRVMLVLSAQRAEQFTMHEADPDAVSPDKEVVDRCRKIQTGVMAITNIEETSNVMFVKEETDYVAATCMMLGVNMPVSDGADPTHSSAKCEAALASIAKKRPYLFFFLRTLPVPFQRVLATLIHV